MAQQQFAANEAGLDLSQQKESAAKLQHDFSCNRKALKNIRKLSEWFVKHRSFSADNMRKRLGAILEERFGE